MKKFIVPTILVACLIACFVYINNNNQPISSDTKSRDYVVSSGESLIHIATKLEENKLIRNRYVFLFYTYKLGIKNKIQSGKFRLSPSLSTRDLAIKLSQSAVADYWLKIIDGQRVEEITPRYPKSYEGHLFPDSYLIPEYFTSEEILAVIEDNFDKKFKEAKIAATNTSMSDVEILILASLIEREARTLESKQMVAGILLNRFSIGMGLQVDASVQYARDSLFKPEKYWLPLKSSDLDIKSAYNTYKNRGLPPTPICSPGYNALYAAFHPTNSDYMYYITGNDNKMHYAKTLSEHNANISKYLNN